MIFEGGVVAERLLAERARRDRPRGRDGGGGVAVRLCLDVVGLCKKRGENVGMEREKGGNESRIWTMTMTTAAAAFCCIRLCLVAATPPLDVLWGAHLRLRGCVKLCPAGNNLLEVICSIPEGFSLCPANCRAGNLGFSPSLINCNYLFEILKTAAKTMTTTAETAATPKSSRRSEAAMGGALEGREGGRRRRNGRGRSVGRTMGKSTPIIPSMQLAQCPLLKTVQAR